MKICVQNLRKKARAGTTLTEMVVTLLVFGILMAMVTAVLHPATKTFIRMQKLQYAQIILDNTIQELRGIVLEASGAGYVKIYPLCGLTATGGATELTSDNSSANGIGTDQGKGLEFVSLDQYVMLVSADGSPQTDLYVGTTNRVKIGTGERIEPGRLLVRYYKPQNGMYDYKDITGGKTVYVARAVTQVFADSHGKDSEGPVSGYYMGNYVGLEFSFPEPCKVETDADGEHKYYNYVKVKVSLYNDPDRKPEHLVAEDTAVLDFRYPVERRDSVTAKKIDASAP